jgi:hypothetical protein
MEYGLALLLVMSGIIVYLFWDTYFMGDLESVKSGIDGKQYMVRGLPDKQQAADLLAQIRGNLMKLQEHLNKLSPDDKRTQQINRNFNGDNMRESIEKSNTTSYSINKGEKIIFCLRSRDVEEKLADINTMMFVAIHEFAHIGTKSIGHTPEFWENFKWILQEAINIGIYKEVDYKSKPQDYCGMKITGSPLD